MHTFLSRQTSELNESKQNVQPQKKSPNFNSVSIWEHLEDTTLATEGSKSTGDKEGDANNASPNKAKKEKDHL